MPTKVQIQIVTWNSRKHLEQLFRGIQIQKGVEYSVLVIDNASEDGTMDWIRANQPNTQIIQNTENRGFAAGHNQGFEKSESSYVLMLNPDTELQEGFLRECVDMIESDEQIASVGGILYQQLPEEGKSGVIDSLGLKMRINGQILDIGQNTRQKPDFSPKIDVFGVTGACALYRLSSLKQVKDKHGILDERFGLYSLKDDADLAWRLNNAKYKAKIAPLAIAYHSRRTGIGNDRKNRPDEDKQTSIRNHLLMLKKNLKWHDWRIKMIIGYEFAKFIYVALFERQNLKAYKSLKS
ncbi:glycosyltransferase family 2 protein [Patescibacteria group bacterium]|nr:glycosyltransferase family 2 protein [Patescibacteria group bacterium]